MLVVVKPTLYDIFSYILYKVFNIKPIVEKKFKTCFIFTRLFRGGEVRAYKIKPVLFFYAVPFFGGKKIYKRKEKRLFNSSFLNVLDLSESVDILKYEAVGSKDHKIGRYAQMCLSQAKDILLFASMIKI